MRKEVKVIPAQAEPQAEQVLRVAAYCRVSTDHKEQQTSLKSQVAYYTQKICETPEWDFAGIYAELKSYGLSLTCICRGMAAAESNDIWMRSRYRQSLVKVSGVPQPLTASSPTKSMLAVRTHRKPGWRIS